MANSEIRRARPTAFIAPSSSLPANAVQQAPWGTTEAVDLFTGKQVWDVPLGTLVPGQQTGPSTLGDR